MAYFSAKCYVNVKLTSIAGLLFDLFWWTKNHNLHVSYLSNFSEIKSSLGWIGDLKNKNRDVYKKEALYELKKLVHVDFLFNLLDLSLWCKSTFLSTPRFKAKYSRKEWISIQISIDKSMLCNIEWNFFKLWNFWLMIARRGRDFKQFQHIKIWLELSIWAKLLALI